MGLGSSAEEWWKTNVTSYWTYKNKESARTRVQILEKALRQGSVRSTRLRPMSRLWGFKHAFTHQMQSSNHGLIEFGNEN